MWSIAVCNAGYYLFSDNTQQTPETCKKCDASHVKPEKGDATSCPTVCDPQENQVANAERTECGETGVVQGPHPNGVSQILDSHSAEIVD